MNIIIEHRASIILYNILNSNNIGRGTVLLPANICPIVPATLLKANTRFKFIDIHEKDYSIDTDYILDMIKKRQGISSIIISNTYGAELEREDFFSEVKSINENIFIIYDRCLNIPILQPKKTVADLVLQSTGYSKYIDLSYGGFAFTQDNVKYQKEDLKYNHIYHEKLVESFNKALTDKSKFLYEDTDWLGDTSQIIEISDYFDEIKAKINNVIKLKESINNIYQENILEQFQLGEEYNNWRFNIVVNNKHEVLEQVFKNNLFASSHYQSLVGIFSEGESKNAELLHSKVINLFNDFRFSKEKAVQISDIINKYAK